MTNSRRPGGVAGAEQSVLGELSVSGRLCYRHGTEGAKYAKEK